MFYIYAYCDPRYVSEVYQYQDFVFPCKPFYIGKGKDRRYRQHLQNCMLSDNSIKSNTILKIKKEGLEPNIIKIYTDLDEKTAFEFERNLILYFGRLDIGTGILTNFTNGGEGFSGFIFTDDTKKKMSEKAKGTKTYSNNGQSKIVEKMDLEGNSLAIFSSLREAGEKSGICFKTISSCCRGVTKTAGGFKWRYLGRSYNPPIKKEKSSKSKTVYQYNLEGAFISDWSSVSEVERTLKIGHVSCACLGKINFTGGYQWS